MANLPLVGDQTMVRARRESAKGEVALARQNQEPRTGKSDRAEPE